MWENLNKKITRATVASRLVIKDSRIFILKNMAPSKLPDDETLRDLYTEKLLTMRQIAERYGVTIQRVQQRLAEMGVKGRTRRAPLDAGTLRALYCDARLTHEEIASHLDVSVSQVERDLRTNRITRPRLIENLASRHTRAEVEQVYIAEGLFQVAAAEKLGVSVHMFQELLVRYGITYRHTCGPVSIDIDNGELRQLYVDDQLTISAIAANYGCTTHVIRYRLKKLGIPMTYRRKPR